VLPDPAEPGQSPAARAGIAHALAHAYERVVMVPGDCPALDRTALAALLGEAHASPPSVTIVPDRHGTGTNALVLTPPDVIDPGFGPGSFERHRARAAAAGATWRVELPPGLTLDIDTPEDLAALRVALARSSTRTAALIGAP
jgi:2-phospho-L-lactate guanylyltransferase